MAFRFRQFSVEDDRSTMKTGTDSVLLGRWAEVAGCSRILEIGTGCGVISLMLAQRSDALIDAIDIDEASSEQAARNFRQSPWNNRLVSRHISLEDLALEVSGCYDMIVTNPPYFASSLRSPEPVKNLARHHDAERRNELLSCSAKLLGKDGKFSVIIPAGERNSFCGAALKHLLFLSREMKVITRQGKKAERILLEFSFRGNPADPAKGGIVKHHESGTLTIRDAGNAYTSEYLEFTKEFYISLR